MEKATKRGREESEASSGDPQRHNKIVRRDSERNKYRGFSLQHLDDDAASIIIPEEEASISPQSFFDRYVALRRPCIIKGLQKRSSNPSLFLQELVEVAGDQHVQVERRFNRTESFGQNRTPSRQLLMTVSDFVERIQQEDGDLYYLSTQEGPNEDAFQVPCKQLLEKDIIPDNINLAGNLLLHSCNLWIGRPREGSSSSSGLHNDFHDNFYLLKHGVKHVRLFSPDCAPCMYLHGEIDQIHSNGLVSYVGSETRADGVPIDALLSLEGEDRSSEHASDNDENGEDEEDGAVFFGKGFKSDSDSEGSLHFEAGRDDFDEIMAKDKGLIESADTKVITTDDTKRPDSFSKIDVEALQDATIIADKFPQLSACRECIVTLKEGQTLFLPAGWFHEFTSGTDMKGAKYHAAFNYWYHPPDSLNNFEQPYSDREFWNEQRRRNEQK